MVEAWLIEIVKALGKVFLNPLLYWFFILMIITGHKRIQKERSYFGFKIFNLFSEWKRTWIISITAGLFISLLTLGVGFVFSYETILLLSVVTILLSMNFRCTMLSPSYTIGITYLLLLLAPFLLENQSIIDVSLFTQTNFTILAILLGLLLIIESIILMRVKRNETFPELSLSNRGVWVGGHRLKRLSMIPFFALIPTGYIEPFANFWPYFSLGGESFSLLLVPFMIGFDYPIKSGISQQTSIVIGKSIRLLGFIVLLVAISSIFFTWLSIVAVMISILGKEYINYKHRIANKNRNPYFNHMDQGLKVLSIMPGTPADRLGILVGETIYRVNGQQISMVDEFYEALQESGAYFKLEVFDERQEVRFVQGAFYDGDHHKLGIVFTDKPYRYYQSS